MTRRLQQRPVEYPLKQPNHKHSNDALGGRTEPAICGVIDEHDSPNLLWKNIPLFDNLKEHLDDAPKYYPVKIQLREPSALQCPKTKKLPPTLLSSAAPACKPYFKYDGRPTFPLNKLLEITKNAGTDRAGVMSYNIGSISLNCIFVGLGTSCTNFMDPHGFDTYVGHGPRYPRRDTDHIDDHEHPDDIDLREVHSNDLEVANAVEDDRAWSKEWLALLEQA
ncbi:hypothetical protein BDY21DRAFT_366827 [Lineolata rhizophorae]|uniref:Uncharacterized protein n=1 Tax=Lineolata rhizophorae TaxID=578093 RepID=A0A6A6NPZ8_9PEZI|nr:hypothetical protein BDY21DRAFT_366827 [Lineolata rhizophorae]